MAAAAEQGIAAVASLAVKMENSKILNGTLGKFECEWKLKYLFRTNIVFYLVGFWASFLKRPLAGATPKMKWNMKHIWSSFNPQVSIATFWQDKNCSLNNQNNLFQNIPLIKYTLSKSISKYFPKKVF